MAGPGQPKPQAIILAGGKGQRFWPLSRTDRPKQLLNIVGGVTLLKSTYERLKLMFEPQNIWVVTLRPYASAIRVQLPEVPADQIILEPVGRNTTAPIGLCSRLIQLRHGNAPVAVFPSDHIISKREKFTLAVETSLKIIERQNVIVTIGAPPHSEETGYGYIRKGRVITRLNGITFYRCSRFVEKPNRQTAKAYVRSRQYLWNAGIFIFRAEAILAEFARHLPKMHQSLMGLHAFPTPETMAELYEQFPFISIDYAVMEKAHNIAVMRGDFVWSDLGSWSALEGFFEKDTAGIAAKGKVVHVDSRNCFVFNTGRLVALVGVENLHVVETADAILICRKDEDQNIKKVVEQLNQKGWKEYT
ncbi:MAG: mannose-1-phosphate guanylyltransferase [Nitrospirae bacterium]|nr:mannose-1-phosphate guanylyltransferase [Nitrospirota bacterium]